MPRGPPVQHCLNCHQTCQHGSNHCYLHWVCSAWGGSQNALSRVWHSTHSSWTPRLTTGKTSFIEQLAYKNKAFIIVLQETHCTTADELVISNFSLAGSVLNRNHGFATFVYERLEWSPVNQSPEQSETEWLCIDVAGYNIINVFKPPRSWLTPMAISTFPYPSLYVGDFNWQHVNRGYKTYPDSESLDA